MADHNIADRTAYKVTISATATFQLEPGARYVIDLSGTDGGSTVSLKYLCGDGTTYTAYPDDPGAIDAGIEIVAPASGVIQVSCTGGSSIAIVVNIARIAGQLR